MIRVLVAEDSLTVRELIVSILESDPAIEVVGQAKDGRRAVELATELRPDLITMDVQMPLLDGLEATKEIMVQAPTPILIVSSRASQAQVELSLNAVRAGALMVLPTPDGPQSPRFEESRATLLSMVKAMAGVKVVRRWSSARRLQRPARRRPPPPGLRLVAVAASTGGPAALQQILSELPRDFPVPIVAVQHIAVGFVPGLAQWLTGSCNLRVKVAEDGEELLPRTVYLAPDHRHLGVEEGEVVLSDEPPLAGFRPSASHLFASAARAYGASLAAVILTGMGRDGVEGLRHAREAHALIIAQDESTSVVYGMPGEAVAAGVVDAVLPLPEIAPRLIRELVSEQAR